MGKILVTGASGYIGSFVARFLSSRGHRVVAAARNPSRELATALPSCDLIEFDVLATTEFSVPSGECDVVIHTATANDIVSRDFEAGVELSVVGTRQVLGAARAIHAKHVVFFSTLQVYGTELEGIIDEATKPAPRNDYGLNHLFGEMVCRMESERDGFRTTVLRPSNVFGCPASHTVNRWSLVPMCFVKQALVEGRITLRSSGRQRRDFVSLRQVAESCEALVESDGSGFGIRNIAGGATCRILDVANWTSAAFAKAGMPRPAIETLGEEPSVENHFEVLSTLPSAKYEGGLEAEMVSEIEKTIDLLHGKPWKDKRTV